MQLPQSHAEVRPLMREVLYQGDGLGKTVRRQGKVDAVSHRRHEGLRSAVLVSSHEGRRHQETGTACLDIAENPQIVAGRQVQHQVPIVGERETVRRRFENGEGVRWRQSGGDALFESMKLKQS